jgi:hypothetical protein
LHKNQECLFTIYLKRLLMRKIFIFYYEGFRESYIGKTGKYLWAVILIKLFIMFFILKLFFFPDLLKKNFQTDRERSNHVLEVLTGSK